MQVRVNYIYGLQPTPRLANQCRGGGYRQRNIVHILEKGIFFFFFCGDLVSSHVGYTIPIYIPRQNTTPGVSEKAVRYNTYISDMLETE